jgi:hypothetical protein
MRWPILFLLTVASLAMAATPPDALDTTRRLAGAGAPQLALDHVERWQPKGPGDPLWAEWETLRIELLARLDRHEEILARVRSVPANGLPETLDQKILYQGARAAVAGGAGAEARAYAARLLWRHRVADAKEVRLLVIESYIVERNGDAAFRSMLRFQQDFQPLDRDTARRFVSALLDLGAAKQAVNWLARLEEADVLKLRLRLRAGLLSPTDAAARARALATNRDDPEAWRVLADVALATNDRPQYVNALERSLQAETPPMRKDAVGSVRELWEAYSQLARGAANQAQLLAGDDAGWGDYAARRLDEQPVIARAFFAHLAQNAKLENLRHNAQYQLVSALRKAKLERVALRLFSEGTNPAVNLDHHARGMLGEIASTGAPLLALRYWEGLPVPSGVGAADWHLRVAAVALRARQFESASAALRQAFAPGVQFTPELVRQGVVIARDLIAAGRPDDAAAVLEAALPRAGVAEKGPILIGLGEANDLKGQHAAAAGFYLRAALPADGKQIDAERIQARLSAARALHGAGYAEDARAQYEWVIKNARFPAQAEVARRELAKLRP